MEPQLLSTLTSPTNQSYSAMDSNIKRLEGSSVASHSLPEQSPSISGKVFLQFEQFTETRVRKDPTLSIKIDQNFDCRMIDAPGIRNINKKPAFDEVLPHDSSTATGQYDTQKSQQLRIIVEYREKIEELSNGILHLKSEVANNENEIRQLRDELESSKQGCSDLQMKNDHLKLLIRKRDQTISSQKQVLESFSKRFADMEKETSSVKQYEERLKDREVKLRQSTKKADKLSIINKTLTKELKDANLKIMQLEKQVQTAVCTQLQEHRSKLKESTMLNKQNFEEGNYRKSFEGSKKPTERVFTSTTTSGSIRPSSNHPIEKRVKSISNIHKPKY